MPFHYNPHRHVKIWLSTNPDSFLNIENQLRLVQMRDRNPTDEITFVYDSSLLSKKALGELKLFCEKQRLIPKDVQVDILPNCKTQEEKNLIPIYLDEIQHINAGGSMGLGSDILRWLEPVYKEGTYSDFDVRVDTRNLKEQIEVEKPLLMNLGSIDYSSKEVIVANGDILAIVDGEAALPEIQTIQKTMYESCIAHPSDNPTITQYLSKVESVYSHILPFEWGNALLTDSNYQHLAILNKIGCGKTARETREQIISWTKDNVSYSKACMDQDKEFFTNYPEVIPPARIIFEGVALQKKGKGAFPFSQKVLGTLYEEISSISTKATYLTKFREKANLNLLKASGVHSGPGAITALFENLSYDTEEFNNKVTPYSIRNYDLESSFSSKNSVSLHSSVAEASYLFSAKAGELNDLSWLKIGQNATAVREQKIEESALTIQGFLRTHVKDKRSKIVTEEKSLDVNKKNPS